MTVIAVTGHRDLIDSEGTRRAIDEILASLAPPVVGITTLAAGADQLFAEAIVAMGAELQVVVPGRDYADSLPADAREGFDRYLRRATSVTTLDIDRVGRDAYLAAGLAMLDGCDLLLAVWDGEPSRGRGGTADLVREARERGIPVRVVTAGRA